jgi:rhodanese-related sulfurtransferase
VCRISISPDSCVRQTENFFDRWGAPALVIAKFIPGLSMVAPPLAGAMSIGWGRFLAYNGAGALIWAGTGLATGLLFQSQVDALMAALQGVGAWGLLVLGVALAAFLAWKWWERQKVFRTLAMARITPDELYRQMDAGHDPVILDVRSRPRQALDFRRIPGAIAVDMAALGEEIARLPRDRDIVVYCACPNEASAAKLAGILVRRGFERARPLLGGIDAWASAGYALEPGEGEHA